MELDQLFQTAHYLRETSAHIQPFGLDSLGHAFQLLETAPVDLPSAEKGIPTISGKSKSDSKDKERKHKKHKEKDKEHKKHKHRHKDRSKDKDKEEKKDGDHSKKHHDKKRKHDSNEDLMDIHKHKKTKAADHPLHEQFPGC